MQPTSIEKDQAGKPRRRWGIIALRIVLLLFVGWLVSKGTAALEVYTAGLPGAGGFKRGVIHGLLMPFALPNLLCGQNVSIYQVVNDGRLYNLGYVLGINACGLLFFGYFFWRLNRMRRLLRGQ